MDARTDRLIGRAALIAILALAGMLAASAVWIAGAKAGWWTTPRPAYAAGDRLDVPAAVYDTTPYTLVLFARSSCGVCESVLPFHQSLIASLAARTDVRIVLMSPVADRARELDYAHALGLKDDGLVAWPAAAPRVRVVPTLVIVNQHGTVLGAWEGRHDETTERAEVLAALAATGSGTSAAQ